MVIPPSSTASKQFSVLCKEQFGCKPSLVAEKCLPIDKLVSGRIPRFRIVFRSEETRNSVLADAKRLRFCPDAAVKGIYINPDLTPSEARSA